LMNKEVRGDVVEATEALFIHQPSSGDEWLNI